MYGFRRTVGSASLCLFRFGCLSGLVVVLFGSVSSGLSRSVRCLQAQAVLQAWSRSVCRCRSVGSVGSTGSASSGQVQLSVRCPMYSKISFWASGVKLLFRSDGARTMRLYGLYVQYDVGLGLGQRLFRFGDRVSHGSCFGRQFYGSGTVGASGTGDVSGLYGTVVRFQFAHMSGLPRVAGKKLTHESKRTHLDGGPDWSLHVRSGTSIRSRMLSGPIPGP